MDLSACGVASTCGGRSARARAGDSTSAASGRLLSRVDREACLRRVEDRRRCDATEEERYQEVQRARQTLTPAAHPHLLGALDDSSWRVRKAAVAALVQRLDAEAAWDIIRDSQDPAPGIGRRAAALELFDRFADRLQPRILDLARSPHVEQRKFAVEALTIRQGASVVGALLEAADDIDGNVRTMALEGLARMRDPRIEPLLQRVIVAGADREPMERIAALHGLDDLGACVDRKILDCLIGDPLYRNLAIRLLARSEDDDVGGILCDAALSPSVQVARAALLGLREWEQGRPARRQAIIAAMRNKAGALREILRRLYRGSDDEAVNTVIVLAEWLADAELCADLYALRRGRWLEHKLSRVLTTCGSRGAEAVSARLCNMELGDQRVAIDALYSLADPVARPFVSELLLSADDRVARSAARYIGKLGDAQQCMALAHRLDDPDPGVVLGCERALREIAARHPEGVEEAMRRVLDRERRPEVVARARAVLAVVTQPALMPLYVEPEAAHLSPIDFKRIRNYILKRSGIYFADADRDRLERRLLPRLDVNGMSTFTLYGNLLLDPVAGAAEFEEVIEAITTHETYFFRERNQLRAFSEEIVPELMRLRGGSRRLRVWSAGCSTGEEPYTVAILLRELGAAEAFRIDLLGTDISRRVLVRAQAAEYGRNSFRDVDQAMVARYFTDHQPYYRLREDIRTSVRFEKLNLLDEDAMASMPTFDVVFCRNVLIYFHVEAKRRLVQLFYEHLAPGGFLLLGHAESLLNISTDFETVSLRHDLVYRKPLDAGGLA